MRDNISTKLLYALAVSEENTLILTVFEDGNQSTIYLEKNFAEALVENINRHIQLL